MIMKVFNDRVLFTDPFRVVFLCGSKFNKKSKRDKRIVLKDYIEKQYPDTSVIILEDNFIFKESNSTYLSYDEICMKNLLQIELLVSLYASKIIVIHESHSTAAEIGAFSSKKELLPRIAIIAPDKYSVEEDKLGVFLERSLSHQDEKNTGLYRYYPDIVPHPFSENKSDYYCYFHNNIIGENLGRFFQSFLNTDENESFELKIQKSPYNKETKDTDVIEYFTEDEKIRAFVHPKVLKAQILSLMCLQDVKKFLKQSKRIIDHVGYIQTLYEQYLVQTIQEKEGDKRIAEIKVSIKNADCTLREAIGCLLFVLQAAQLIQLQTDSEDKQTVGLRKVVFQPLFTQKQSIFEHIIVSKKETAFGRSFV